MQINISKNPIHVTGANPAIVVQVPSGTPFSIVKMIESLLGTYFFPVLVEGAKISQITIGASSNMPFGDAIKIIEDLPKTIIPLVSAIVSVLDNKQGSNIFLATTATGAATAPPVVDSLKKILGDVCFSCKDVKTESKTNKVIVDVSSLPYFEALKTIDMINLARKTNPTINYKFIFAHELSQQVLPQKLIY